MLRRVDVVLLIAFSASSVRVDAMQRGAALPRAIQRVSCARIYAVAPAPPGAPPRAATVDGGESPSSSARWKRPRQHVNPLASHHQRPLKLATDWDARAFDQPRPLHIDIGCAAGHFCVHLADARPGTNVLGLEIRESLVERANGWADVRAIGNLRFLQCNANVDLPAIASACRSPLASVSIQFPDPWFKKRHHKRRVVQPELVEHIAARLPPGGTLFVQSDVRELAEAMREQIEQTTGDRLAPAPGPASDGWLDHNPIGIATEREIATARKGGNVWRALYTRL
ncbi:hypothetical protein KFE25_007547 [Diacronema lutheri]|uniref:tRNA (guanine(46)-N(7))-methyltransferase n=2 Tax=Diacronema lutheri TaxID=2081491 RepID=A0A8J6CDW3_DIALT|nr:hypothetical protein KFE25_007547 [Diacronema lutheri]